MSRLAPIKARELLRILRSLGFEQVRQRGSHTFWKHPDGRTTVVPVHAGEPIGRGLLRKILNDVEIEPEEFDKLR
jgi:predicted RNA binding protein YcfA (HicA-like mRNA interferase family)